MAPPGTVYRLKAQVSDVDRGVYEQLDLRLAQHPSETLRYMLTRALAFCLAFEPGIEWSHGLANADEPALWVKSPDGRLEAWIEVGLPSAERLHRASKACARVLVYCHHEPALLVRETQRATIHRLEHIQAFAIPSSLLDALEPHIARNFEWQLVHTEGQLYLTLDGKTYEAPLTRIPLV